MLARHGVQAASMQPSFPSLTFPNHYTLVTGLRPDHHGIVDNTMFDPQLGKFSLGNRKAVSAGRWLDEAMPLWVTAAAHGVRRTAERRVGKGWGVSGGARGCRCH